MKSFFVRLASGIVLLAIAILTMAMGNLWLLVPLCAISLIAYRELTKALGAAGESGLTVPELIGLAGVICYYVCAWFVGAEGCSPVLLLACVMFQFMAEMFLYVVTFPRYHAGQIEACVFSFIYAPVMLAFVFLTRELGSIGIYTVWLILICSWGCDTCAYAVGIVLGKHKIFPQLSPKKTLEGCIGGVLGSALIGGIYGYFIAQSMYAAAETERNAVPLLIAVICAVGAVMSMVGDLAASAIKRNHGIKDYGNLIPGHGGIMDRFDSMIVTAPMTYFLVLWMLSV